MISYQFITEKDEITDQLLAISESKTDIKSELREWLRRDHDVHIVIEPYKKRGAYKYYSLKWKGDSLVYISTINAAEQEYSEILGKEIKNCLEYLLNDRR